MVKSKGLIWQPEFCSGYDFKVYLDQDFARKMINAHVPTSNQSRINELANEDLKRFSINWENPYLFHDESGFISQFYIGRNGVWLSTSHQNISDLLKGEHMEKPIEYDSHNVDLRDEAYVLMYLFDKWIKYADAIQVKK